MEFNTTFSFDDALGRAVTHPWDFSGALSQAQKLAPNQTTVDDKIRAKLTRASGAKVKGTRQDSVTSDSDDKEGSDDDGSDDSEALPGEMDDDSDDEVEVSSGSDAVAEVATANSPVPPRSPPKTHHRAAADSSDDEDADAATAAALSQLASGGRGSANPAGHTSDGVNSNSDSAGTSGEEPDSSDSGEVAGNAASDGSDVVESDDSGPVGEHGASVKRTTRGRPSGRSEGGRSGEGAFYAETPAGTKFSGRSFADLGLSRPLTKAVAELGFATPTPIQAAVVPLALLGRDIVASAITGSGKTAAFALPMLERLLFRQRRVAATHVLVLAPTRELAAQVHSMICQLARFTDVRAALVVGGLSLAQQAAELRTAPEIVVATPGRVIDHILNTMAFDVDALSALILDEADRLLEMGFQDELRQIIKRAPRRRQTLLFSATMTTGVQQLVDLSLTAPVRLAADAAAAAPRRLKHEVLRLRGGAASADKAAVLCALCSRALKGLRAIVFCRQKRQAHRLKIMLGLAGLPPASELHGDMTQAARLEALEAFRTGSTTLLLATDVAARGLDILGVNAVVNYDCPRTVETYLHRVGRTARAGRGGRAVTFAEDGDRRLLKDVVAQIGVQLARRDVPPAVVDSWRRRLEGLAGTIDEVLQEETTEKALRTAEMEATKASNMVEHQREIMSRPRREWFQTSKEKKATAKAAAEVALMIPTTGAGVPEPKKGAKAAKNADAKGRQSQDTRPAPGHVTETKKVAGAVKAAKSAARQFQQSGSKPREAAKAALTATGATKKKKQPKKRGREGGAADDTPPADKLPRVTRVYAGGGKSSKVQAPKTGLSKPQKAKMARKGKGRSQFKGKTRYKRK